MRSSEIRKVFLDFFKEKDHLILPSFSLIPKDDPSLLLIGAGMAPLKPYFTGAQKPPHPRIATCQKCLRTPDIARVGLTARHATFFEMLGNFSFGDYFKKETIAWAWELVTEVFSLPAERLWISVYKDDEESYDIWKNDIGIAPEKIVRLGEEDNFWEIGEGPCGPCSEIYYDFGPEKGCGDENCAVGCDCDRFLEIWNLVFTQFDKQKDGQYLPLAQKNIDTGMGLERIAAVLQGVPTIFEIDIIKPILDYTCQLAGKVYGQDDGTDVSLRIITEHIRGISFLIGDGVIPSNEGRGYVLRRLLRRAVKHGWFLGFKSPFLYKVVPVVIGLMENFYPELRQRELFITEIVQKEESKFLETLALGMDILDEIISNLKEKSMKTLSGAEAFKLYDTYGFPLELTEEILAENDMDLDREGFQKELEKQRQRARAAVSASFLQGEKSDLPDLANYPLPSFVGYENLSCSTIIEAIYVDKKFSDSVSKGQKAFVLLKDTPFYAESGGQVSDQGYLQGAKGKAFVLDTIKGSRGHTVHICELVEGTLSKGEKIDAFVDIEKRLDVSRNHTATHLLHRALINTLGEHVQQAGSLVAPERLRFDFTHFSPLDKSMLDKIEKEVNRQVWHNRRIKVKQMSLGQAKKEGATALFDEKYGDQVRVVEIDDYSKELCGGTHVNYTGEIGIFKINAESSIGSGLRRIEAITGRYAYDYLSQKEALVEEVQQLLNVRYDQIPGRLLELLKEYKMMRKENDELKLKIASCNIQSLLDNAEKVNGTLVIKGQVSADDMSALRKQVDLLRDKIKSGIVVLGSVVNDKVIFAGAVTKDLVKKGCHAGKLLNKVASLTGGGGGGRPDMAQAGGKDPALLEKALNKVSELVQEQFNQISG
ncbi:MAG: alanine--tRNA ligase [Firmicutes bacterium]|nr:alanine--tRNA ligase [Bacillota bacterium]